MRDIQAILQNSLIWDTHAGVFPDPAWDVREVLEWHRAGVHHISLDVVFDVRPWQTGVEVVSSWRRQINAMDSVEIVNSVSGVEAARREGRLAVSFDIEGANALNNDPGMVEMWKRLGVNQMLLAYNLNTAACGGCHDGDCDLTGFGKEVISEMNRVGMIIDASHAGATSAAQIMEASRTPVVFTHSNPRSVWDHERNISDDLIKLCAQQGGVIGINGLGIFLGSNVATSEVFADHASYVADLVGPEFVAIGLDWKPEAKGDKSLGQVLSARPDYWPASQGYHTAAIKSVAPRQIPEICKILAERGWSDSDLVGFLGENFARVAGTVWGA